MSRETVLARAQAFAIAGMVDTCLVRRLTGSTAGTDDGRIVPTYSTIYAGKCRVRLRVPRAQPQTVGQAEVFVARLELHIPTTVTGVASDDLVTVTASLHDQDLLGRVWHIRELSHETYLSARRFSMIEVTS